MKLNIWELSKIEKMLQVELKLIENDMERKYSNEYTLLKKIEKELSKQLNKIKKEEQEKLRDERR